MGAGFTGPRRPQRSSSPSTRARTSWAGPWGISSRSRCRGFRPRSEEHTSELQSQSNLVCRLLLEKKKKRVGSDHVLLGTTQSVHYITNSLHLSYAGALVALQLSITSGARVYLYVPRATRWLRSDD